MSGSEPASSRPSTAPQAADNIRPVAALPSAGPPLGAVILGCLIIAIGLFVLLEGRRAQYSHPLSSAVPGSEGQVLPSIPPLNIPPPPPPPQAVAPPPPPPAKIVYIDRPGPPPPPIVQYVPQPAPAPPPPPPTKPASGEAALVVDLGVAAAGGQAPSADEAAARAVVLQHRALLVPQGTIIPAVLETPIDSTRGGLVRALTSADIRGFDGSRVLIPKGSRLVGEFKADVQQGQTRVLVTWNRLVRPDGVAIRLTSPATDALGGSGIAGNVNNHFLERFASVALQTAVTVGTDLADRSSSTSVVVGVPGQTIASAGQTLIPTNDLKPTIQVKQGASITIFVARDLDFSGASARP